METCRLFLIGVQALIFIILSYMTLDCRFRPHKSEYHEVTLMKMLYLYDPEYCGKVIFYNHTLIIDDHKSISSLMWPDFNGIAESFRQKMSALVALHVLWFIFSIGCLTQDSKSRSGNFYGTTVPFTVIGVTILIFDLVNTVLFMIDAVYTESEIDILQYIQFTKVTDDQDFVILNKFYLYTIGMSDFEELRKSCDDTSWIALLMAFFSSKGIVQWFVNMWIIKDAFLDGLKHKRLHAAEQERNYLMSQAMKKKKQSTINVIRK